jgi:hypothetical protein
MPGGNPLGKMFEFGSVGCGSDACEVEACIFGGALDNRLHVAVLNYQQFPLLFVFIFVLQFQIRGGLSAAQPPRYPGQFQNGKANAFSRTILLPRLQSGY